MIVVKIPFRLSIGGGGTDLPAYYSKFGGLLITSTINKYMYVVINENAIDNKIRLYYKWTEIKELYELDKIDHNIIRESLKYLDIKQPIEIGSYSEIPAQTGLGSSSVFTVGLLAGLHELKGEFVSPIQLAEEACHVEIDLVGKPIGKQDQYAAALGGFFIMNIDKSGKVVIERLNIDKETIMELECRLLMFYTGQTRDANEILGEQSQKAKEEDQKTIEAMHIIKSIGQDIGDSLLRGDIDTFGMLLHEHWLAKNNISEKMSSSFIDECYLKGLNAGALGGKIIGSGGGGFLLLLCRAGKRLEVKAHMEALGLKFMDFRFEYNGVKTLIKD